MASPVPSLRQQFVVMVYIHRCSRHFLAIQMYLFEAKLIVVDCMFMDILLLISMYARKIVLAVLIFVLTSSLQHPGS